MPEIFYAGWPPALDSCLHNRSCVGSNPPSPNSGGEGIYPTHLHPRMGAEGIESYLFPNREGVDPTLPREGRILPSRKGGGKILLHPRVGQVSPLPHSGGVDLTFPIGREGKESTLLTSIHGWGGGGDRILPLPKLGRGASNPSHLRGQPGGGKGRIRAYTIKFVQTRI